MSTFKLVIGDPKTGKSVQQEVKEDMSNALNGLKIGDTVDGATLSLTGYEFVITGGSDDAGFPMRKDVTGTGKKKILAIKGVGLKKKAKGIRQRKTVAGNTIHDGTAQINLKILKQGSQDLFAAKKDAEGTEESAEKEKAPEQKKVTEQQKATEQKPTEKEAVADKAEKADKQATDKKTEEAKKESAK